MIFKGVKCKNLNHLTQKCLHLSTNAPKSIVQLSIGERNQKLKQTMYSSIRPVCIEPIP